MKRGFLYISFFITLFSGYNILTNEPACFGRSNKQIVVLPSHPVHISFTNIEFNPATNKFDILFKLFVDDFDIILTKKYGKTLNLSGGQPIKGAHEIIDRYILEHFKMIINGKDKTKSELKFNKMEVKELSIWLYYDFSFNGNCNTFDLQNSLMTDLYQDQNNLLIFTYKDAQKAIKFSLAKTEEKLTF
jgi:hypothetical protein